MSVENKQIVEDYKEESGNQKTNERQLISPEQATEMKNRCFKRVENLTAHAEEVNQIISEKESNPKVEKAVDALRTLMAQGYIKAAAIAGIVMQVAEPIVRNPTGPSLFETLGNLSSIFTIPPGGHLDAARIFSAAVDIGGAIMDNADSRKDIQELARVIIESV